VELRYVGRVFVNDANTDAAAGHAIAAAHAGYKMQAGAWEWTGLLRVDNLFDRKVAGSVIVNEGNGRFFEPAPGRTWLAAMSATRRF
jgi:iron complex outermembrane receptor protein